MPYEHQPAHGTQVYAASAVDPEAPGVMLVRQIGPHGATGKLMPVSTTYGEPIGGGKLQPIASSWAQRIGPKGAYGPLIPMGNESSQGRNTVIWLSAAVFAFLLWRGLAAQD
jgi:hypothetical protein